MKKFKFSLILFLSLFTLSLATSFSPLSAALLTVNRQGEVIWQILGEETSFQIPKQSEIEIKTIAENDSSSFNSQIYLTNEGGKVLLKVTKNGQTQTIDVTNLDKSLLELQAREDANNLKIATDGNLFTIEEEGVVVTTSFPITVDPVKNELSVVTPSGSRLVSVLPREVALSLIRGKFIDNIKDNRINLTENADGELEYQVDGNKNINLFNLAQINAEISTIVSASSGKVTVSKEPQWLKFFGFLFS